MRAWLPPMAGGLTRPAWFALALLVALAATAGPAQAQTRLLVGNTTAGTARNWEVTSGADFSQAFTTGANSAGYTVANVEIAFNGTPTAADLTALTVTVRTVAEGNNLNPGPASAVVGTFTDPGSGTAGLNTFTAPGSGIQLEASTTYFIHLDVGASSLATGLSARRNARADPGSATGWSIADYSRRYVPSIDAWGSVNAALEFKLNGQATPQATAPAKPVDLMATAGDAQVTLGWTDPSNSDITRWQFRQRTGGGSFGSWTEIPNSDADTATHTVTGLTNGTAYGFQIRALAGTLQGAASDTVSATPQAPPARFTVSALQVGNQVTLIWSAGGGSITGFQFRQGTGPSSAIVWGAWTNIGNVQRRGVTGLSFATTYHYQVRAVAGTVLGTESATVTVTTAPGRPTDLAAVAGDGEVALSWIAPSGALTAHEYRQRAAGGSWGAWTAISDSAAINAHTVTGLTNGTEYQFQVRARSGSADSQASVESNTATATPVATPAAPTGLTATPANVSVSLSWTLPAGDAITGYQYRQGSGDPFVWGTWTDFSNFSGPYEFGRTLTGLTNGTEYSFQVRAVVERTVGGATMRVLGAASDTVTATPQPPPARPTNLVAAAGNARVTLTWDDPDDDAITAYFYRYRPAGGSFTDDAQVNGDTFTVTVTGLTNGTAYEFRVYASRGGVTGRAETATATPVAPSSPGLVLDPTSLTVAEGGSGTYTVKLATRPTGNVTVTVAVASGDVTVDTNTAMPGNQSTLTFTTGTWSTAQTVTVSAGEDDDTTNDSATLTHSASGGGYGSVTGTVAVTVTDNDTPAVARPAKPAGLVATAGDAQVTLGWDNPSNSDITRWQFRQRTGGGGFGSWTEIPNSDADTATHTVTGLANGTAYGFQIRAVAGTVNGAISDTASATPQATQPSPPPQPPSSGGGGGGGGVVPPPPDPAIAAAGVTATGATLTVDDVSGVWHYRRTLPEGGECSGPQSGESAALAGLMAATEYAYGLYADSACAEELASVGFTTPAPPPSIAAAGVTDTGATLTAANVPGGVWRYRRTLPEGGECSGPQSGESAALAGLMAATEYAYGLYADSACAEELASVGFTTPAPPPSIAATGVTDTGATLTAANVPGGVWRHRRTLPEGGECSGPQSGESAVLAGLVAATEYAYGLYADSACSNELASVGFTTPAPPPSIAATGVTDTGATLTAANVPGGVWRHRRTLPEGGECSGPQSGESAVLAGLVAATEYAYGLYADSACANELASVGFTTPAPPPSIAATGVTDTGATLTAANVPGGVWRHRRTLPEGGECSGPQSGESAVLAGLMAATEYAYGLYADSACANELASVGFTTGPSTNAALAGLALATRAGGAAALAPAFSPEADAYSASLPFAADSALLTPRTAHPDATARVGPRGGPLAAVPAQGEGAAVPLSVGVNGIVVEVTAADGATKRTVTLSITRAAPGPLDGTAATSHLFPLFADGGGFRSRLLVAHAAGGRARCELALHGAGLDAVRFSAEPMSALPPAAEPESEAAGIGIRLAAGGGGVALNSAGAGELAFGHAKLDCDGPVAAQLLLSLEAGGALSAMAHQSPAERGRAFSLPGLPAPLRLGLAFANDGVRGNLCVVEAAEGRGVVAVPPGGTSFRLLDEIVALADGGGTGPVAVRCERPAALLALPLGGGVFTAMPAAVLDGDGAEEAPSAAETETAAAPLPLVLDGGGFRSRLSAVNLAAGANRCELRLSAAGGLAGANFGAAADGPEGMDGFALALAGRGAQESLDSRGGEAFAFGHAALECEGPAALWNLIVLDGPDGPAGMMALGPAQPAREMRFRAPPAPARLGLAIANGGGARTACHVALAAADGGAAPPAGFPLISVPARATAIRFLDEMFAVPADFAGGAATLRCDHAVGAVAVPVAGAAFTAVPPIIPGLETVPEAAVDSGGGTPGGNQ